MDRTISKIIYASRPLPVLNLNPSEWTSFITLIQELMVYGVRRNHFTQLELDLLLDVQTVRLRKSPRAEALRQYLKAVQQSHAHGATEPPKFLLFLDQTTRRATARGASG